MLPFHLMARLLLRWAPTSSRQHSTTFAFRSGPSPRCRYWAPLCCHWLPLAASVCLKFALACLQIEATHRLGQQPELRLVCKDTRVVRVCVEGGRAAIDQLAATLRSLSFPGAGPRGTFAFKYTPHPRSSMLDGRDSFIAASEANMAVSVAKTGRGAFPDRWDLWDPEREYTRIGFLGGGRGNGEWRLYRQDFKAAAAAEAEYAKSHDPIDVASARADAAAAMMSPTYPEAFVVPSSLSDPQIVAAAGFRSKSRMPAATWMDSETGAVLARSSQPMAGMGGKRSAEDVLLLEVCSFSAHLRPFLR